MCIQALKNGWKGGLRPFIGLDGTFLKGKCKRILLVALGQDSVKHFYPLAGQWWTEKHLKHGNDLLRNFLDLTDGEGLTFMFDMLKVIVCLKLLL